MSFLNKQTFQLSEKESILSKHDEKKFSLANSKKNEDIIGNVNSFREDLRKQITEKLRTTSKIIDTSSPKQTEGYKSLFSSRASDSSFQNDLFKRQLTAKSSEKKFDLVSDLLSKKQIDASANKTAQKSDNYFSDLWEKKRDSQRVSIKTLDVNSFFSGEPEKRPVSPFRDQTKSTEFGSTNLLKKSIAEKPSSLFESKSGSRTPKQSLKEDINKIFETTKTPTNAGKENKLKIDTERSYKTLTQEISKLRSSRTNLLDSSPKPKELTPKHSSNNYFFNELRDNEKETRQGLSSKNNFLSGSLNTTENILFGKDDSTLTGEKKLLDRFPLSKIYEIQDIFYNVSDKDFNDLAPEYVEELIKLSSVIMHRVKNSNYYTKS